LGVGLTASATFVALNNYFVKRRGQAIGFSLAGTAFGMMLMPQAVTLLLDNYGFRAAILILGAFAANSLVGSVLLQPAKWHYIPEEKSLEEGEYKQEMETIKEDGEDDEAEQDEINNLISNNLMVRTFEELKAGGLTRKATFPRNFSTMSFAGNRARRRTSKESIMSSYSRLDFTGSSIQLAIDTPDTQESTISSEQPSRLRRNMSYPGVPFSPQPKIVKEPQKEPVKEQEKQKTSWQKVVEFMDFDLLKDPIYLNLVFGLSVFYVAEQNFKMVMPFFFKSINYEKHDVALFLSVQAFTDILARLILPPICDRLDISKRTLFMSGIFFLGICRSRKIRDSTNSYPICLHSQTFLIMLCVVAWSIEYCILYCRTRTGESEKSDTDTTNT
ncbi:hypothetical protein YQE_04980, partial [Dendroctonus ponderosae]